LVEQLGLVELKWMKVMLVDKRNGKTNTAAQNSKFFEKDSIFKETNHFPQPSAFELKKPMRTEAQTEVPFALVGFGTVVAVSGVLRNVVWLQVD
jgi:hypothetical protein